MSQKIDAIADYSGASHGFKLQAIEILDILSIEVISNEAFSSNELALEPQLRTTKIDFESLQKVTERVSAAQTLEALFDTILQAIDLEFGLRHSMILIKQGEPDRLFTISTRGYDQSGVGSEVKIGEGVIGRAAEMKIPLAYAALNRDLIYARSSSNPAKTDDQDSLLQAIPLPGLKTSRCQLAVPVVLRGELLGVLFAESENIHEIRESDENILETLSHVLALAIHGLQVSHEYDAVSEPAVKKSPLSLQAPKEKLIFNFFQKEDCIMLNGEYLIRNVPARILWKILNQYKTHGKSEFTNRELRMDAWLQLPEVKDNLETRLILLRKRLEKKCPSISIASCGRGRISLAVAGDITLSQS